MDFSSLLSCLTRERLVEVGRALGLTLPSNARKERQVEAFLEAAPGQLAAVVGLLQRDELKVACRQHGLADGGRARFELARRLLVAAGIEDAAIAPSFAAEDEYRELVQTVEEPDPLEIGHQQELSADQLGRYAVAIAVEAHLRGGTDGDRELLGPGKGHLGQSQQARSLLGEGLRHGASAILRPGPGLGHLLAPWTDLAIELGALRYATGC